MKPPSPKAGAQAQASHFLVHRPLSEPTAHSDYPPGGLAAPEGQGPRGKLALNFSFPASPVTWTGLELTVEGPALWPSLCSFAQ